MNKGRLIWGIICVVFAALLVGATLAQPPENTMFMVGEANMPWLPPLVIGIVGIVLVVSGVQSPAKPPAPIAIDPNKAALNKQLETGAWGAFLILLGASLFISDEIVQEGWWSIGVGVIMLGLNVSRRINGLRMSGFTTLLGILSIAGGILDLAGVEGVSGAILLIVLGAYLLLKPWFEQRQMFGKAEQA
jgi:hypothetical protein